MLIVSTEKTPPNFDKFVCKYLFKIKSGLYIGDVTKPLRDFLIKLVSDNYSDGIIFFIWNNANSHCGFELFEISRNGGDNTLNFDGIRIPKLKRKSSK